MRAIVIFGNPSRMRDGFNCEQKYFMSSPRSVSRVLLYVRCTCAAICFMSRIVSKREIRIVSEEASSARSIFCLERAGADLVQPRGCGAPWARGVRPVETWCEWPPLSPARPAFSLSTRMCVPMARFLFSPPHSIVFTMRPVRKSRRTYANVMTVWSYLQTINK